METSQTEQWKPILEGAYEVSDLGRVRRIQRAKGTRSGRFVKVQIDTKGYSVVKLSVKGESKMYRVHRLVMQAFAGSCHIDYQVNHKDTNKRNNRLDNLEYLTQAENIKHAIEHGLIPVKVSASQVREIREAKGSHASIARIYGVHRTLIGKIKNGQRRQSA